MDVKRLAAIDMHGLNGSTFRRRLILWEFIVGALGGIALGLFVLVSADSLLWTVFGVWLISIGLNYVPLTLHAINLSRPGALQSELRETNVRAELRRYTGLQGWVFVPLALVYFALTRR